MTLRHPAASLTFQFKECLQPHDQGAWDHQMGYRFNEGESYNSSSEGGWGASELRARMNPGIENVTHGTDDNAIWNIVPDSLKKVIAQVDKKYTETATPDAKVITSSDSLFITSYSEVTPTSHWAESHPWTLGEGSQYEFYRQWVFSHGQYSVLIKHNVSASAEPVFWWERTVTPDILTHFLYVSTDGGPGNYFYANDSAGVSPCFCL